MNNIITIICCIAIISFVIYNMVEIVLAHKFYKKIEKEHQELIDKLIDKTVDDLLGDKNEER